jgi:hypothetical protein
MILVGEEDTSVGTFDGERILSCTNPLQFPQATKPSSCSTATITDRLHSLRITALHPRHWMLTAPSPKSRLDPLEVGTE